MLINYVGLYPSSQNRKILYGNSKITTRLGIAEWFQLAIILFVLGLEALLNPYAAASNLQHVWFPTNLYLARFSLKEHLMNNWY